jgi:hypothetical protein
MLSVRWAFPYSCSIAPLVGLASPVISRAEQI